MVVLQEKLTNWLRRSAGVHSTYSLLGEQELHVKGDKLILPPPDRGIEPRPSGCEASALPLSYRAVHLVVMRLRLGYRYYWEVSGAAAVPCGLCHSPAGHTLAHYIMECPLLVHFRPQGHWDLPSLISWFINHDKLPAIIKEFPHFSPPL